MLASYYLENQVEAGVDEVGRGCVSGPVVAAAVILPLDFSHKWLNDSKQVSASHRLEVGEAIKEQALAYAIAEASVAEIDTHNILQATYLAMHRAIENLELQPDFLLIDGNRFKPYPELRHACFVKGDAKYKSIAAASILAKNHRDTYMETLAQDFPEYDWEHNVGYPTPKHIQAIAKHGITIHHRKSFVIKSLQPTLFD